MNGLKRRYEYRETKRKMRCLLCIREWSEKTIRIQRDEEEDEMSTLYPWMVWKDDTNTKGWSRHQNIHLIRPMSCVFYLRCFLFELFCFWVVFCLSCVWFELCFVWKLNSTFNSRTGEVKSKSDFSELVQQLSTHFGRNIAEKKLRT